MSEVIPIDLAPDGGHLIDPPIVDSLQFDRPHNSWVAIFIPEDEVSRNEKEVVSIPVNSTEGLRISLQVRRLSRLLDMSVSQFVHDGDGNFTFKSDGGVSKELAAPNGSVDLSLRAYVPLSDIAMTAQIAFLQQNSIASSS